MDSNETLYGGDPKFLSEINKLCETLIGQILDHLKALGRDEVRTNTDVQRFCFFFLMIRSVLQKVAAGSRLVRTSGLFNITVCQFLVALLFTHLQQSTRRQGAVAFSLFGVLLAHGDLRNNKLSQLAVNLWNLSHKHGYCETRISVSSHPHLRLQILFKEHASCECSLTVLSRRSRFGLWSPSNTRLSSPTWLTCQIQSRGSPCSPAPEHQSLVYKLGKNICASHIRFVWVKDNKKHKEGKKCLNVFCVRTLDEHGVNVDKPFGFYTLSLDQIVDWS